MFSTRVLGFALIFFTAHAEDYLLNPSRLAAARSTCEAQGGFETPACQSVLKAHRQCSRWMDLVAESPQRLGLKIIRVQQELVELEHQRSKGRSVERLLQRKQRTLQHYLAFVRWCHSFR